MTKAQHFESIPDNRPPQVLAGCPPDQLVAGQTDHAAALTPPRDITIHTTDIIVTAQHCTAPLIVS